MVETTTTINLHEPLPVILPTIFSALTFSFASNESSSVFTATSYFENPSTSNASLPPHLTIHHEFAEHPSPNHLSSSTLFRVISPFSFGYFTTHISANMTPRQIIG